MPMALLAGWTAVGLIELGQVFVASRVADVTDVMSGAVGAAIGVMATARAYSRQPSQQHVAPRRLLPARVAVFMWIGALCLYHWNPFDFTLDAERVAIGMRRLTAMPFSSVLRRHAVPLRSPRRFARPRWHSRSACCSNCRGALAFLLPGAGSCRPCARVPRSEASRSARCSCRRGCPTLPTRFIGGLAAAAGAWITGRMQGLGSIAGRTNDLPRA